MTVDTKKYRLLKDLPDAKIGTEFIEDNDDNCYNYTSIHGEGCWYNKHYIENNPEWFEEVLPESIPNKQDERIEVSIGSCCRNNEMSYNTVFQTSIPITSELSPKVKQAIEQAINSKEEKTYTQSEVDTIRKETWEAARETTFSFKGEQDFPNPKIKYPTLQDYLNSLSKPSTTPIEDKGNVLFTTVDGIGIKAYDIFYYVGDAYNVCETFILPHEEWKQLRNKSFSTKEAAEQYILKNKPCLSLSDLFLLGITEHHKYYKMLSILAKQKLNQ